MSKQQPITLTVLSIATACLVAALCVRAADTPDAASGANASPSGSAPAASTTPAAPASGDPASTTANAAPATPAAPAAPAINVKKLFATNCSWCHDDYGMAAGKGPRLAGTDMTEKQVYERIKNGKSGAMPSFAKTLSPEQIAAFAAYIKSLKPQD